MSVALRHLGSARLLFPLLTVAARLWIVPLPLLTGVLRRLPLALLLRPLLLAALICLALSRSALSTAGLS